MINALDGEFVEYVCELREAIERSILSQYK